MYGRASREVMSINRSFHAESAPTISQSNDSAMWDGAGCTDSRPNHRVVAAGIGTVVHHSDDYRTPSGDHSVNPLSLEAEQRLDKGWD